MKRYLYFTVFMSGMSVLAIELTASRLLGPAFGVSNLVWASIIGLILIYLTVGYFLGGQWADRSPFPLTMYSILAWGGFTSGLVPFMARPVVRFASNAFDQLQVGVLFGSFTAVLLLFVIPITLLGTISPFAIRLSITDPAKAGATSGRIYAVSTLGSFIGTFLPVLVLTPLLGTTYTFITFSMLLILVAAGGLWLSAGWRGLRRVIWMPLVLLVAALVLGRGPIKSTVGQIYETESAYNYIQVLERSGYRYLRLNEGQGIHSVWHPSELDYQGPWEQFLAAPFFNPSSYAPEDLSSIAVVGLAAGTTARQATIIYGPVLIDGFEIDPEVIEVGREFFEMDMPNLNAVAVDGRIGLQQSPNRYDLVIVDAYRPPYIPWHLATREFFELTRERMTENGVLAINVGRGPNDRRMIDALASTISTVYPSVYVMDVHGSFNSIVYATRQPTEIGNLYENLNQLIQRGDVHPLLLDSIFRTVYYLQPTPEGEVIFTDELAPVEWITNNIVLNFVFSGDYEEIEVIE
jgi:predicted membrane-bound spermidine synthase